MIVRTRKHNRTPGTAVRATAPLGFARALELAHFCGISAPPAKSRTPGPLKPPAAARQPASAAAPNSAAEQSRVMERNSAILQHGAATGRIGLAVEVAFGRPSGQSIAELFE
jgi:hypothetical protein